MSPCARPCARLNSVLILLALFMCPNVRAEPMRSGQQYFNARYGFSLTVPADILRPAASKNPEKGAAWESSDGKVRLLAVATENANGDTLQSYRQFLLRDIYSDAEIDYAPIRDNWFVLSGRRAGTMFYERIVFACDGRYIYGWQLNYPASDRGVGDRVVEAIHRSYRAGRGEDGKCGRS